jgi:SAM-dependent methyltransferase
MAAQPFIHKPPGFGPDNLFVGATRSEQCGRTIEVFVAGLSRLTELRGHRVLDVGCGDGSFTKAVTAGFAEVHAIDIQTDYLDRFRTAVADAKRFHIQCMSASAMAYPSDHFDVLISLESLEHIPDLAGAVGEFWRVLRPGGDCVITCPNRLFPFENHGIRWRGREIARRIPLLPYLPPLHDRLALARVFTVRSLDRLFRPLGFHRQATGYLWPTFEHGGNRWQPLLRPLFGLMRRLERSPLRMFGSSIAVCYRKPADGGSGRRGDQPPRISPTGDGSADASASR